MCQLKLKPIFYKHSQVKSSQVKIFYSGKYTIISYNIGKTETHLGLFVPLWDEFTVDMWLPLHWPA